MQVPGAEILASMTGLRQVLAELKTVAEAKRVVGDAGGRVG